MVNQKLTNQLNEVQQDQVIIPTENGFPQNDHPTDNTDREGGKRVDIVMDISAENLLQVTIMDRDYVVLIDTGADYSVVSQEFFEELSKKAHLRRVPDDKTGIRTAGGKSLPVNGRCEILMVVQGVTIAIYPRIVPGIISPLVIGMEFLAQNGAMIDFAQKKLNLRARSFQAMVIRDVNIPPGEERSVQVAVQPLLPPGTVGLFRPNSRLNGLNCGLIAGERVIGKIGEMSQAQYDVINPTKETITLQEGDRIASMVIMEKADLNEEACDENMMEGREIITMMRNNGAQAYTMDDADELQCDHPYDELTTASENLTPRPSLIEDESDDPDRPDEGGEEERCAEQWVKDENQNKAYPTWDRPADNTPTLNREDIDLDTSYLQPEQRKIIQDLVLEHRDVFALSMKELTGVKGYQCKIDVFPGSAPVRKRPYRASPRHQEIIDAQLDEMLEAGIIEPSMSEYASPIVLVQKPDGSQRLCLDYRDLNAVSPMDSFPLIPLQFGLDILGTAKPKYMSLLDLASGYWQIEIAPEDRHKTAFCTINRHLQCVRLPFGLVSSGARFMRVINSVLSGMLGKQVFAYVDDILVASPTFEQHVNDLREVFQRFRRAGFKLKSKKCHYARRRVKYLGHLVSDQGIEVDPQKVAAVETYPVPETVKQLRSFLGIAGFYRRHILGFANIASPLNRLLRKEVSFEWDDACQEAFKQLKSKLTSAPVLGYPDYDKPFKIYSDASRTSLGAVMAQIDKNGKERVISYAGRTLLPAERRSYSISELEAAAICFAMRSFEHYVREVHVQVITDHLPLVSIFKSGSPSKRIAKWVYSMAKFDYEIKYEPGRQLGNADSLSRRHYPKVLTQAETEPTITPCFEDDSEEVDKRLDRFPPNHVSTQTDEYSKRGCEAATQTNEPGQLQTQNQSLGLYSEGMSWTLSNGMSVSATIGDITTMHTGAIVNACNEHLRNGAGVALAIARAAGPQFDRECRSYIQNHGPLNCGQVVHTGAGHLKNQYVFHAVGPRGWEHSQSQCISVLKQIVYTCLQKAEQLGLKSVAIPAISAGLFGLEVSLVTRCMSQAVIEWTAEHECPGSLQQIYLIDINPQVVKHIVDDLTEEIKKKNRNWIDTTTVKKENQIGNEMPVYKIEDDEGGLTPISDWVLSRDDEITERRKPPKIQKQGEGYSNDMHLDHPAEVTSIKKNMVIHPSENGRETQRLQIKEQKEVKMEPLQELGPLTVNGQKTKRWSGCDPPKDHYLYMPPIPSKGEFRQSSEQTHPFKWTLTPPNGNKQLDQPQRIEDSQDWSRDRLTNRYPVTKMSMDPGESTGIRRRQNGNGPTWNWQRIERRLEEISRNQQKDDEPNTHKKGKESLQVMSADEGNDTTDQEILMDKTTNSKLLPIITRSRNQQEKQEEEMAKKEYRDHSDERMHDNDTAMSKIQEILDKAHKISQQIQDFPDNGPTKAYLTIEDSLTRLLLELDKLQDLPTPAAKRQRKRAVECVLRHIQGLEDKLLENAAQPPTLDGREEVIKEKGKDYLQDIDLSTITPERISRLQMADTTWRPIMNELKQIELGEATLNCKWEAYLIEDGLLYHNAHGRKGANMVTDKPFQLAVPTSMIPAVIRAFHDSVLAGHRGIKAALSRIREWFFWPNMERDIKEWIASCQVCNRRGRKNMLNRAPLQPLEPEVPLRYWQIDIAGKFPRTPSNNAYILTCIDIYSKYVVFIPIPSMSAQTVARALFENICCKYGAPANIQSDRGSNFISAVMKSFCKILGIQQRFSSAYHSMSQGAIERSHQMLEDYIAKFIQDEVDATSWDLHVAPAAFVHNTTVSSATGLSPNLLVHGRELQIPGTIALPNSDLTGASDPRVQIRILVQMINEAQKIADENLKKAQSKMKIQYDKKAKDIYFEPGSMVWLLAPGSPTSLPVKLRSVWSGPYRVLERKDQLNYILRSEITNKQLSHHVHVNRLREYTTSKLRPPEPWEDESPLDEDDGSNDLPDVNVGEDEEKRQGLTETKENDSKQEKEKHFSQNTKSKYTADNGTKQNIQHTDISGQEVSEPKFERRVKTITKGQRMPDGTVQYAIIYEDQVNDRVPTWVREEQLSLEEREWIGERPVHILRYRGPAVQMME